MELVLAFFLHFALDADVFEDGSLSNGECVTSACR